MLPSQKAQQLLLLCVAKLGQEGLKRQLCKIKRRLGGRKGSSTTWWGEGNASFHISNIKTEPCLVKREAFGT